MINVGLAQTMTRKSRLVRTFNPTGRFESVELDKECRDACRRKRGV